MKRLTTAVCFVLTIAALLLAATGCPGSSGTEEPKKKAPSLSRKTALTPEEVKKKLEKRLPPAVEAANRRKADAQVLFVDGTREAGIDFYQDNGRSDEFFYVEILGNGAIFFDADGDGDPDLYLLTGHKLTTPAPDPMPRARLYLNDGKGHFTVAPSGNGLDDPGFSEGVCGADYDNDGDIDLYVNHFDAPNSLYRSDGNGHFTDVAKAAGVLGGPDVDSSCAFGDIDNDGLVDLSVGYYLDHSRKNNKLCAEEKRDGSGKARRYCNPKDYNPLSNMLFRNRGNGTFENVSVSSGIDQYKGRTLSVDFADFDDDGDQDLFAACDRTANLYLLNDGKGHFRNIASENGTDLSEEGKAKAGMGSATGDYDNDGRIDFAVTYFEKEWNGLYHNQGGNRFTDEAVSSGTANPSFVLMGWGTELLDADNDGHLDWVVANGHLLDDVALFREPVAGYEQPNLFFLNNTDGTFTNMETAAGPGWGIEKVTRGIISSDIDADGDLDILTTNLHANPDLLRNDSPRGEKHWLIVRTAGTKSNRDGIGARLTAKLADMTITREIHSAQSYYSQSDMRAHFGLGGNATVQTLDVKWPSGRVSHLEDVAADQVLTITEPVN